MGARTCERRSSGFSEGAIAAQSDTSRGPRGYLAVQAAAALACCFLPLADHLGYEFSEVVALVGGMFGGLAGMRRDLKSAVLGLVPSAVIILLKGAGAWAG